MKCISIKILEEGGGGKERRRKKIKRKNHPITGMPMGRISPKHLESVTTKKSEISVVTLWALA